MKKLIVLLLALAMVFSLASCSTAGSDNPSATTDNAGSASDNTGEETPKSDVILEIESTWTDASLDAFKAILADYTELTGVQFDVVAPGEDYETQMKIRMSSDDLPDLFFTHGWSVIRYSEYLLPLNDQPWYNNVSDAVLGVISDADSNIYVLPISMALSCICVNLDVLDACGVDWTTLTTWDKFEAACETIKAAGYAPIIMGAKDSGNAGGLINSLNLSYMASDDSPHHDQIANLLAGDVDLGTVWNDVFDRINSWRDKGYFNTDYMTLDTAGMKQALGAGETAFCSRTSTYIGDALGYNPDANLGLMAYPAVTEGGMVSSAVGEGTCIGVWKDSEYQEEALAFLAWLATPDVASRFLAFDGGTAALNDTPDDSVIKQAYTAMIDAYGDNIYFDNMFDRKYLPNGMWNVISEGTALLLDGTSKEEVGAYMQENFDSLYAEAHAS